MSENKTAQGDLMYACGTGSVTQDGSTSALTFPTRVPMTFIHAQSLIKFHVTAGNDATASNLTINNIKVDSVSTSGTFTVTHTNYNAISSQSVDGAWSSPGTADDVILSAQTGFTFNTTGADFASLLVVPSGNVPSFTINYTLDSKNYSYTYTPATAALAKATKYLYNITITLHEILVTPSVENWGNGGGNITVG